MDKLQITNLRKKFENHIKCDIMPFWDTRCIDEEDGGYITCFDREGNVTDTNKYGWFQGRQLYIYSLLYNRFDKNPVWLKNACHGFEFLKKYCYAGDGRWNYILDKKGNVIEGTISIYSDFHILQGVAEFLKIDGMLTKENEEILVKSYDVLEKNVFDPEFKEIYENTWSPKFIWHDMYLTCLATVETCTGVLGIERTERLLNECVDRITNWFAKDEYNVIFEAVTRDNKVDLDSPHGRFVNPGHMHESAWFCMHAGELLENSKATRDGVKIARWANRVGMDKEGGGIISYADALGEIPEPIDWFKETNSLWNEKVWWPNAEALAAYSCAYYHSRDNEFLEKFINQTEFCMNNFFDKEFKEWYERLDYDGTIKNSDKGTPWKCSFHLVRALFVSWSVLKKLEEE